MPALGYQTVRLKQAPPDSSKSNFILLCLFVPVFFVSVALACSSGAIEITAAQIWQLVWLKLSGAAFPESKEALVLWELRLPRALLAFGVGSALGVAGIVLQSVLQNHLADPFTLGVASGAAFGASLALTLGLPSVLLFAGINLPLLPLCALVGAILALLAVFFLGRSGAGGVGVAGPETLVLAGVVCSSFLAALISLVKALNEDSVASIVFWIMGSLQGRGWQEWQMFWPLWLCGLLPVVFFRRALDLLCLGPRVAVQLGLPALSRRLWLLLAAGLLAAGAVSVAGIIGFVGLLVPHVGRLVFVRIGWSSAPSRLLLFSAFTGGLLLLWADLLARRLLSLAGTAQISGAELPVGVLTALIGAPLFCYLLRRQHKASGNLS